ncbi:MAG: response regulator transcription factor [Spirulina sp.]
MPKILIVEDEPRIASVLSKGLVNRGFATVVVDQGQSAIHLALGGDFDLMLLDLGLPDQSGLSVLKAIRERGETLPIILLTVYDDLPHKVQGLTGGADDYLTKPFHLEELVARIQVQLRKRPQDREVPQMTLQVGNIVLDLHLRQVQQAHRVVELSTREFTLLELLMRRSGEVVQRVELLQAVWGYDYDTASNVVDVYVGYLRKKLGHRTIETVRGVGYRLRS